MRIHQRWWQTSRHLSDADVLNNRQDDDAILTRFWRRGWLIVRPFFKRKIRQIQASSGLTSEVSVHRIFATSQKSVRTQRSWHPQKDVKLLWHMVCLKCVLQHPRRTISDYQDDWCGENLSSSPTNHLIRQTDDGWQSCSLSVASAPWHDIHSSSFMLDGYYRWHPFDWWRMQEDLAFVSFGHECKCILHPSLLDDRRHRTLQHLQ